MIVLQPKPILIKQQKPLIMLKKLPLFLTGTFCAVSALAQTIVSTSPENRNVVLEEFTGVNCFYCPDGHRIAQSIQDNNPDRVALINIHQGGYANPSGNQPDFRTQWGNAIAGQTGLTGYPAGTVNRHVFSGSSTALGRGQWTGAANQILGMPSYVNVGVEATINVQTRELVVNVEAYYTGNSPESTNFINIALLQNNTKGPQNGGGQGNNYNHMHRLVELLTGQWGDEINTTTQGSFVARSYTYTIPAHYRNIEAVLRDMEVVAFVTETRQEIITGKRTIPSFTGVTKMNDAMVKEIIPIDPTCATNIGPSVVISNEGANSITSLPIQYKINGVTHTHTWTGNLGTYHAETIALPAVPLTLQNTNTLEILLPNDEDNSNNSASLNFNKAPEGTSKIYIEVRTDNWGYEFRWALMDSNGTIVHRRNNFPSSQTVTDIFTLPEDCYTFVIYDSFGDGGARVEIKDHNNQRLFFAAGNWGVERSGNFSTDGVLSVTDNLSTSMAVYPNPTKDILNISGAEKSIIAIYDILGKLILEKKEIRNPEEVQVSQLQAGTYFIKISRDGETTTKKFIVTE